MKRWNITGFGKRKFLGIVSVFFIAINSFSQGTGIIKGRIFNSSTNESIPYANIVIWGTNIGSTSDFDGNYIFTGVTPGFAELRVSAVGFETAISEDIMVTNANPVFLDIPLKETDVQLDEVVVKASPFRRTEESPVSLRRIGLSEIEKNPGGNRDISRVIQSLPGVTSSPSFRNDLIVRGGGSSENRFYLDGVEIPNLNHFATQGASGGPTGIINVDFIREVNFYSGAFPTNRGNALSSVLEFRQADGNMDHLKTRFTIGASDIALALDGPISDNSSYVFSLRRSYLQLLFKAIGLPFLPTYNDFQFKFKFKLDEKNELSFIGLGALDLFSLNRAANETPYQRYILNYIPVNEQWNYTLGAVYKHYRTNGYDTWVISRNHLNNVIYKNLNNDENLPRINDLKSNEVEQKFRFEKNINSTNGNKWVVGLNTDFAHYDNYTKRLLINDTSTTTLEYNTDIDIVNYGGFAQMSRSLNNGRLTLSGGMRLDGSNYSDQMSNPFKQFSPRISFSYGLTDKIFFNANTGRFYQRPSYTMMGYRDPQGELINKINGLTYISSDQVIAGFDMTPTEESKLSIEGFYKYYRKYPFSVTDSVSMSGKGADFGTYGDEPILSISEGRSYGIELLARSRNFGGFTAIMSYTLYWSQFKKTSGDGVVSDNFLPNSWDNRHLLNITGTKRLKSNWDLGLKWRFIGGAPYTPFDTYRTSLVAVWDANGQPRLDYSQYNQKRLKPFHQLDIRIDKQFFFPTWSLMFYVDVQNVYNFKSDEQPILLRKALTDESISGADPYIDSTTGAMRYQMEQLINNGAGTVLPTVGIIIEL